MAWMRGVYGSNEGGHATSMMQELEYGDLVCLVRDVEALDGRMFLEGTQGWVCAVYNYDEMPLMEVHFPYQQRSFPVNDEDVRLLERSTQAAALQIIPRTGT